MIQFLTTHPRAVGVGIVCVAGLLFWLAARKAVQAEREAQREAPNAGHPYVLHLVNEESERRERGRLGAVRRAYEHDEPRLHWWN